MHYNIIWKKPHKKKHLKIYTFDNFVEKWRKSLIFQKSCLDKYGNFNVWRWFTGTYGTLTLQRRTMRQRRVFSRINQGRTCGMPPMNEIRGNRWNYVAIYSVLFVVCERNLRFCHSTCVPSQLFCNSPARRTNCQLCL